MYNIYDVHCTQYPVKLSAWHTNICAEYNLECFIIRHWGETKLSPSTQCIYVELIRICGYMMLLSNNIYRYIIIICMRVLQTMETLCNAYATHTPQNSSHHFQYFYSDLSYTSLDAPCESISYAGTYNTLCYASRHRHYTQLIQTHVYTFGACPFPTRHLPTKRFS